MITQIYARTLTQKIRDNLEQAAVGLARIEQGEGYLALGYNSMKAYLIGEFQTPYKTLWQWMKHGAFLLQLEDSGLPEPLQVHSRYLNSVPEALRVAAWGYANAWSQARGETKLSKETLIAAGEIVEELVSSGQVTVGDITADANTLVNRAMDEHLFEAKMRDKEGGEPLRNYVLYEQTYKANAGNKIIIELSLPAGEDLIVSAWTKGL